MTTERTESLPSLPDVGLTEAERHHFFSVVGMVAAKEPDAVRTLKKRSRRIEREMYAYLENENKHQPIVAAVDLPGLAAAWGRLCLPCYAIRPPLPEIGPAGAAQQGFQPGPPEYAEYEKAIPAWSVLCYDLHFILADQPEIAHQAALFRGAAHWAYVKTEKLVRRLTGHRLVTLAADSAPGQRDLLFNAWSAGGGSGLMFLMLMDPSVNRPAVAFDQIRADLKRELRRYDHTWGTADSDDVESAMWWRLQKAIAEVGAMEPRDVLQDWMSGKSDSVIRNSRAQAVIDVLRRKSASKRGGEFSRSVPLDDRVSDLHQDPGQVTLYLELERFLAARDDTDKRILELVVFEEDDATADKIAKRLQADGVDLRESAVSKRLKKIRKGAKAALYA